MDVLPPWRLMPLIRVKEPFDHPDWLFELKHDGFRALAVIDGHRCSLVSRRGYVFKQWPQLAEELAHTVRAHGAVLDGEIVVLRPDGSSDFNALLFRRDSPHFYAFDLLQLEAEDLRGLSLVARKRRLRQLIGRRDPKSRLRFLSHVRGRGKNLYTAACARHRRIVAKWAGGPYFTDGAKTSWVKIKNPSYSQAEGRHEFFEHRAESRPRWKPVAYRMDPAAAKAW
jgi:bifunctional non-homologous end joining protein LigD